MSVSLFGFAILALPGSLVSVALRMDQVEEGAQYRRLLRLHHFIPLFLGQGQRLVHREGHQLLPELHELPQEGKGVLFIVLTVSEPGARVGLVPCRLGDRPGLVGFAASPLRKVVTGNQRSVKALEWDLV